MIRSTESTRSTYLIFSCKQESKVAKSMQNSPFPIGLQVKWVLMSNLLLMSIILILSFTVTLKSRALFIQTKFLNANAL